MTELPPPPPPATGAAAPEYRYQPTVPYTLTSKAKRFGAHLLDALLLIVTLVIGWFIWSLVLWSRGQSPAKSLLKMRVYKLDTGRAATFGQMALRELVGKLILGFVPFYGLASAIMVLADDRSQGLWDKIAGTIVIEDPDNRFAPA